MSQNIFEFAIRERTAIDNRGAFLQTLERGMDNQAVIDLVQVHRGIRAMEGL